MQKQELISITQSTGGCQVDSPFGGYITFILQNGILQFAFFGDVNLCKSGKSSNFVLDLSEEEYRENNTECVFSPYRCMEMTLEEGVRSPSVRVSD